MNTEEKIEQLTYTLLALKNLPIMKLAENKQLVNEIKNVLTGVNFQGILQDVRNDLRIERQTKISGKKQQTIGAFNNDEFLGRYVNYQSSAFNVFKDKATPALTELPGKEKILAFNQKKQNPYNTKAIKDLKETKEFKEAFNDSKHELKALNSIFSNRALQIGTSQDPTLISSYIDYSPYTYNYAWYLSIPTLSETIDKPISLATKTLPKIVFEDPKLTEKFNLYFKRSRIIERIQKMLLYSSLSPRGALIVPIKDEGQVRYNIFNDTQFSYATANQYTRIDFHDSLTGVSQIYCLGHILQNELSCHFLCPGFEPIYAIGKNRLYQLKGAAEAINIYLYTIKVLCIRAQVLVQKWAGEGQNDTKLAAMIRATQQIDSELSLSTAVKLPSDAELNILSSNFTPGFAETQPIIKEFQGFLTGLMPDFLYGSQTAYQANNFNLNVSFQNVRSMFQEQQIAPIINYIVNTQLEGDKNFQQWADQTDNFDIEFEPLYEPTAQEKTDLETAKIDNIIKMADYPELKQVFVAEKLWREDMQMPEIEEDEGDELGIGEKEVDEKKEKIGS